MTPKAEGWNIVLAGAWNRMIFTPKWVGNRLFDQPVIETFVSLMPNLPLVYRNEDVTLEVSQPRLVFRPRTTNEECLRRVEQMAASVLQALPDTPMNAVGINFGFEEPNPPTEVLDLFNFADGASIAGLDWEVRVRRIVRQVHRDDTTLNLTLEFDGETVAANFNFHTETPSNDLACAAVNNRAVTHHQDALGLLQEVYNLQLVQE